MSGFSPLVIHHMRRRLERRFDFRWQDVEPHRLAARLGDDVLIIHDRLDREIPWTEGRDLAASSPNAELWTTEGLGHRRVLRDASVTDAAVDFISGGDRVAEEAPADHITSITQSAA